MILLITDLYSGQLLLMVAGGLIHLLLCMFFLLFLLCFQCFSVLFVSFRYLVCLFLCIYHPGSLIWDNCGNIKLIRLKLSFYIQITVTIKSLDQQTDTVGPQTQTLPTHPSVCVTRGELWNKKVVFGCCATAETLSGVVLNKNVLIQQMPYPRRI